MPRFGHVVNGCFDTCVKAGYVPAPSEDSNSFHGVGSLPSCSEIRRLFVFAARSKAGIRNYAVSLQSMRQLHRKCSELILAGLTRSTALYFGMSKLGGFYGNQGGIPGFRSRSAILVGMLRANVLVGAELFWRSLRNPWRDLAAHAAHAPPFQTFEWHETWWRFFGGIREPQALRGVGRK